MKNPTLSRCSSLLSSRLLAPISSLLLCGVLSALPAHADTYNRYHVVADNLTPRGGFNLGGNTICPMEGRQVDPNATSTTLSYSAFDIPGASRSSSITWFNDTTGRWYQGVGTPGLNSSPLIESDYSLSYSHGRTPSGGTARSVGIGCTVNPTGSTGDPYLRLGEARYTFAGVTFNGPTELIYSNVVDGATTSSFPSATDVSNNVTDLGFRGFATPKNPSFGISLVYLTLQRLSDNLYWTGSGWSSTRTRITANRRISNSTTGRVEWSKVGGWPTGLTSGSYKVRTLAVEGQLGSGPGILDTITFTIGGTTPTPTPPPADTTPPQPTILSSPADNSTVTTFSSFSGICNDNTGGVGVGKIRVHLLFEGSPLLEWNWKTQSWSQGYNSIPDSFKNATISGNTWNLAGEFPAGANIKQGKYTVRLYATDKNLNGETYSAPGFTVASASPARASAPATASTPSPTPTPLPAPKKKPSFGDS